MRHVHVLALVVALAAVALVPSAAVGSAESSLTKRYVVVLDGAETADGFELAGTASAIDSLVALAGGTVTLDLSKQIGVLVVDSPNVLFAEAMRTSGLVVEAAEDYKWKAFPSRDEALASGQLTVMAADDVPGGGPEPHADVLEGLQWDMAQIRTADAHATQAGAPLVEVGILDTGIDGNHLDFVDPDGALHLGSRVPFSNVNCAKGRDFVGIAAPGIGSPDPCTDNNFHGTHVAGTVAARANSHGIVGVAPNVELIPVKVCDTDGHCYSSSTVAGITYAGDAKFEVINMSFFVDDNEFQQSTMYKCSSDPVQSAFRKANERAVRYARNQGVVPVAALGNSNHDLAHPPEPYENDCEVVPAETDGVIGTMSLGPSSEKAYYSNYGSGPTDVAAPGGNGRNPNGEIPGPCGSQILSTIPGNAWGCFQGTSMASPHAAGVAALIVSQFGRVGNDGGEPDVVMRPQDVENHLQSTTIDLVSADPTDKSLNGYDGCFGNGRVDALKAVMHDTDVDRQPVEAPRGIVSGCPSHGERIE